ncbi:hypothetical protein [Paracoccus yeei]|uniref:hypothetical protein n=1 Tax=Paracoccus yeei TaxID=147645 RepID=UPI00048D579A|nr:hypothetical protein [Paracoccus yeei]OWJ97142.1 hypothetical protein CDV54_04530 [Paracoccus yeei]
MTGKGEAAAIAAMQAAITADSIETGPLAQQIADAAHQGDNEFLATIAYWAASAVDSLMERRTETVG